VFGAGDAGGERSSPPAACAIAPALSHLCQRGHSPLEHVRGAFVMFIVLRVLVTSRSDVVAP
jgi:hypothetical protein